MTTPKLHLICDYTETRPAYHLAAREDGVLQSTAPEEVANDTVPAIWPTEPQDVLDALYRHGCRPVRMASGLVRWRNLVAVPAELIAIAGRMTAAILPLLPDDNEAREYTDDYKIPEQKKPQEAKPVRFMSPEDARAFADRFFGYVERPVDRETVEAVWNRRGASFVGERFAISTRADQNTYLFRRDVERARALLDEPVEAAE